jgi:hypothetical protein
MVLIWGANTTALAIEATMEEVTVSEASDYIVLSATLRLPFEGKIEDTIHSGIDTTFVFKLELARERSFWFDEKVISREITHTVRYDNLSKQYTLQISDADNLQSLVTTDFDEMKRWMTSLKGIRLFPLKDIVAKEKYYIRVMAEMDALEMPFPLEYIPFIVSFQEFETPWVTSPLTSIQQKQ